MKRQAEQIEQLRSFMASLNGRRYPGGVVCYSEADYLAAVARTAATEAGCRYLDVAVDLLPFTIQPGFFPTLGAYGPNDLAKWLIDAARDPSVASLVVAQAEPLLATFGRGEAARFFQILNALELRKPVCLLTYLAKQVDEAKYPKDRLLIL